MRKSVLNWIGQALAVVAISTITASAAVAQSSVDKEFARELKLVEGLKVYNRQLEDQLKAQGVAKSEIQSSIVQAKDLEPQVAPILSKMLSALDDFVKADLPFHKQERTKSIIRLKDIMKDPNSTTSSRYRSIMDIYNVEMEYGTTSEAFQDVLDVNGDGNPITVDMLRIGRVALYYQTTDQKASGMWDAVNKTWKKLDSSTNRNIRKAIKVAAKTTAPELLSLPISAPEGA